MYTHLQRAARLADADLRDAVGKVRREHHGRRDAAGGAAGLRNAGSGLTHEHDRPDAACRPVEKHGADGARLRRGGNGTLHERIAPEPEPAAPQATPETGDGFAQVRRPVAEKRIDKPQPEAYIDLEAQLKSLTTEQLQIVAAIDVPGTQVDLIIEKTQLPASKVLAELTVLQIRGVVRQEPGKRFSLNVRAGTAQES